MTVGDSALLVSQVPKHEQAVAFYWVLVRFFGKTVLISPCFQKLNKALPAVPKSPDGRLSYSLTLQFLLSFADSLVKLYE